MAFGIWKCGGHVDGSVDCKAKMLLKVWSVDHQIRKLVSAASFADLRSIAVEHAVCQGGDIKVYLMDGTVVDELSLIYMMPVLKNAWGKHSS